jgi:hypothetical protein
LGTATQATGGIYADLVNTVGKVVDNNFDMTGWAADPRVQVDSMLATDTQGRPLFASGVDANGVSRNSLLGWPAYFNKGVSGRYWRAGDSVQTISITGAPTGGTFTVQAGGNVYVAAYNVTTAALQTAIQAWGGIFATVTVAGTAGTTYNVTFPAVTSNVAPAAAPFSVTGAFTGGTSPKVAVVPSGQGGVDSNIRAVAGDWSQAAYGVGMDITFKVSNEASYFDGTTWHSSFQENLTLLLVEAYYGFVIGNPNAFSIATKGSAAF